MISLSNQSLFGYCFFLPQYQFVFRGAAWLLLLVHVFGRPRWTFTEEEDWRNLKDFPQWGISFLPNTAAVFLNLLCLVVLGYAVRLQFSYEKSSSRKYCLWIFAVGVFLKFVEAVASFVSFCSSLPPPFTVSPVEGIFVLLIESRYFANILYLTRTIPMFIVLLGILACAMLTFEALAFLIFNPDGFESKDYFGNWGTGMWNMLMVSRAKYRCRL